MSSVTNSEKGTSGHPSIRRVGQSEVKALQEIAKITFFHTYGADNTPANMEKYLTDNFNPKRLLSELQNPESQFYFAEIEGKIVGYMKLNYGMAQTEFKLENALEIERIYVLSEFQGRKIGQQLHLKALEAAKSLDLQRVWLGVWEENPKAVRFYKKMGFQPFEKHIFKLGNDEQTDIMMKIELSDLAS